MSVDKNLLKPDSDIFVIPSSKDKEDDCYIIIDNCRDKIKAKSSFFHLKNLFDDPEITLKDMEHFKRPINIDEEATGNRLVGYIDHKCEDKTDARVFVSRNDLVVTKVSGTECRIDEEMKPNQEGYLDHRIFYKYFTERRIQAILQLDSWMYTLSNPCVSVKNLVKAKPTMDPNPKNAKKDEHHHHHKQNSNYFNKKGESIDPLKYAKG